MAKCVQDIHNNVWMDELDKINKVLNWMVFFTKACNTIIKADFEQHVKERGINSWKSMRGFLNIEGQSLEDVINISTNLMEDMLVKRREEILKPLALPDIERDILRFTPPQDEHARLFS